MCVLVKLEFDKNSIRNARTDSSFTMEEVAKKLNMDLTAYWRLENGKVRVKAEDLPKLMEVFNKNFHFFFKDKNGDEVEIVLKVKRDMEELVKVCECLEENPDWLKNPSDIDAIKIRMKNY